ncbi:hypothetical protein ACPF8X_04145 [Streptomyces sp. G35A]
MPAHQSDRQAPERSQPLPGVSMRDLLASCTAAAAVSTPPRAPEPRHAEPAKEHREAA